MYTRFRKSRDGVAAVEAALVFPVLIGLLLGALEFSMLLFTNNAVQSAAREVTRQLSVNFLTVAEVTGAVTGKLPSWTAGSTAISVTQTTPLIPQTNLITVSVSLPASKATPLNVFIPVIGDWTLSTSVTMKQEMPL